MARRYPVFRPGSQPPNPRRNVVPNLVFRSESTAMKTVNLKSDMPQVHQALQRLERELVLARQEKATLVKLIHGYGSTGEGGDIRIAVQKRLLEMAQSGQIRGCIFGENWSQSDETAWKLLQLHPGLKNEITPTGPNSGTRIVLLR